MQSRAEHVTLIKVELGQVADRQTDNATNVAHFLGLKYVVEAQLEAPEDHGRRQAHDGVEGEGLGVVGDVAGPEAEDIALVKDVFDDKPYTRTYGNRSQNGESTAVGAEEKILGTDVRGSCD